MPLLSVPDTNGMKVLMLGWEFPPHNSGGLGVACQGLARALADTNTEVIFVKNEFGLFNYLSKKTELIIFDLSNKNIDLKIVKEIRSNKTLSKVRIIGYLSHIQVELKNKALEIGFDKIYAKSEFSKKLAEII